MNVIVCLSLVSLKATQTKGCPSMSATGPILKSKSPVWQDFFLAFQTLAPTALEKTHFTFSRAG
jgi:hypothetical protein